MKSVSISIALLTAIALVGCETTDSVVDQAALLKDSSNVYQRYFTECSTQREELINQYKVELQFKAKTALQNHLASGLEAKKQYEFYLNMMGGVVPIKTKNVLDVNNQTSKIVGVAYLDTLVLEHKEKFGSFVYALSQRCVVLK